MSGWQRDDLNRALIWLCSGIFLTHSSVFQDDDKDDDDDSDDSEDWGSDDDDSSSSDDEEAGAYSQLKGRARWLKKNTVETTKKTKVKRERPKKDTLAEAASAAEAMSARKSVLPVEGLTVSLLNRKVKELAAQRGRKGKDNRQVLRELEALMRLSLQFGPRVEIPILMHVISAQFGLQRTLDDYMDTATWRACASYLQRIAEVVESGYSLGVQEVEESDIMFTGTKKMKAAAKAADGAMVAVAADEKLINPHSGEEETEDERAERIRLEKEENMSDQEKKTIPVVGSLALHLTRLEEEYTKSLQNCSQHSLEYIARLRDESKLVELLVKFQAYFEGKQQMIEAAMLAQLRVEHIYYRHNSIAREVDKAAFFYERYGEMSMLHPSCLTAGESKGKVDYSTTHPGASFGKPAVEDFPETNFSEVLSTLCKFVYKHGLEQAKTRAAICQIYHLSLHDQFIDARDLLLMSHIQETITDSGDIATMIMFNRMMVNFGMCAFRMGRIQDAHQCLSDVCSGRVQELLAQGVVSGKFSDKTAEEEKAEKRRQVPYHQHINLDLLEACHLISAMLLEVPSMADDATKRRPFSRTFRKFYDQYNHQVFTGPPEQTRDFVMRAAQCLMRGDWKTCAELVSGLDVWKLVPGEGVIPKISEMLTEKVKVEGLRTYLFAFSSQYDSLSLSQLCGMFEMSKNEVHSVVSKMMINRELHASWDQPTETIVLRHVQPTSIQAMAMQFADKTGYLVEANERLLDAQAGNLGFKEDWKSGDGDDKYHQKARGGNQKNSRSNNNNSNISRSGGRNSNRFQSNRHKSGSRTGRSNRRRY